MFSLLVRFYCSASPLTRKPVSLGSVGWKGGRGCNRVEVSIKLYLRRMIKKRVEPVRQVLNSGQGDWDAEGCLHLHCLIFKVHSHSVWLLASSSSFSSSPVKTDQWALNTINTVLHSLNSHSIGGRQGTLYHFISAMVCLTGTKLTFSFGGFEIKALSSSALKEKEECHPCVKLLWCLQETSLMELLHCHRPRGPQRSPTFFIPRTS